MKLSDPVDLLAQIANPAIRELARKGVVRKFRRNAEILREGDLGDELLIILAGRVHAYSSAPEGREIIYSSLGAGEYVGEMALDGGVRSASVRAAEPTMCAVVTRRRVEEHFKEYPEFATELIARLIRRIRILTQTNRSLALLGVYQRMSHLFEQLAVTDPHTGQRMIAERLTHQKIAAYVGASREMVSKVLKELSVGGYIKTSERRIFIVKALPADW